jgi:hypothetical protein
MTDSEIGPDDALDGDYGRLLERATGIYVKRVTSPTGTDGQGPKLDGIIRRRAA